MSTEEGQDDRLLAAGIIKDESNPNGGIAGATGGVGGTERRPDRGLRFQLDDDPDRIQVHPSDEPDSGTDGGALSPSYSETTDEEANLTRATGDGRRQRRIEFVDALPSAPGRLYGRARSVTPPRTSISSGFLSSGSSTTIFPDAPDGGYGWVVVFAAFMIHFIADGVSFSFGVMYPTIQEVFNVGKGASGMVASVFLALPLLAGPLSSYLVDRYGCRPTIIVGALLSSTGVFISRWAPNIGTLYVTFGLIAGLGLSFTFSGSIVAVTYYFEGRRSIATGLTVTGTGIGTCVFAPLIEFLLDEYKWDGTLLILSAVLLNQVVFGILIRDLEWPEDTLEYKRERFLRKLDEHVAAHVQPVDESPTSAYSRLHHHHHTADVSGAGAGVDTSHVRLRRCISLMELPVFMRARVETLELAPEIKQQQAQQHALEQAAQRSRSMAVIKRNTGGRLDSIIPHDLPQEVPTLAEVQYLKEQARAHRRQRVISMTQSHYSAEDLLGIGGMASTLPNGPSAVSSAAGRQPTVSTSTEGAPPLLVHLAATQSPVLSRQGSSQHRDTTILPGGKTLAKATSVDVGELPELLLGAEVQEQQYQSGMSPRHYSSPVPPGGDHDDQPCTSTGSGGGGVENRAVDAASWSAGGSGGNAALDQMPVGADAEHMHDHPHGVRERRVKQRAARPNAQTVVARPHAATMVRYRDLPNIQPRDELWLTREIVHARFFSAPTLFRHRHRRRARAAGRVADCLAGLTEILIDHVELLRSVAFVLLLMSSFLLYTFYDIVYVNVPEHMVEQGQADEEHASYIVSAIGVVNTVGMATYGFIADSRNVDRVLLYGASNTVCGLCVLAFVYVKDFYPVTAVCGVFGWFISANYVLGSVIILDIMSMSDFISAYGLIGLMEGIGTLIGPALAGYLYDWTGSYQVTFITGGVGIIVSGLLILITRPVQKCVQCISGESPHVEFVDGGAHVVGEANHQQEALAPRVVV